MKIIFILPFINPSGGVLSTFFLANALTELGHRVDIIYPVFQLSFGRSLLDFKRKKSWMFNTVKHALGAFDYNWLRVNFNLKKIPYLSPKYIPRGDFVVATAWPTAYFVNELPPDRGHKVYFVRGIETWSGPARKVLNTYRLGMPIITTSKYLETELNEMGVKVMGRVPNGVDTSLFYPDPAVLGRRNGRRVLVLYHAVNLKGFDIARKALLEAKKEIEFEIVMFGTYERPDIDFEVEYHRNLFGAALRKLYSSCDIFLWPSLADGWGQPPMEAQACKLALIATNSGGIPEFTVPGETALIAERPDPNELAGYLIKLLSSKAELEKLQNAGYNYIKRFSWIESARKFEKVLSRL